MYAAFTAAADPVITTAVTDIKTYVFDQLPAIFVAAASFIGIRVAFSWIKKVLH